MRLVALAGALGGCNPQPATLSTDPVLPGEAEPLCLDFCEDSIDCGWIEDESDCEAACFEGSHLLRGDAFRILLRCWDDLSCRDDPQVCPVRVHLALEPLDFQEDAAGRCVEALSACAPTAKKCVADRIELLSEEGTEAVVACAEGGCETAGACIDAIQSVGEGPS
jgi:hypothetical protein